MTTISATGVNLRDRLPALKTRGITLVAVVLLYLIPASWNTTRLTQVDEIISFGMVVIGLNITMAVAGQDVIGLGAALSFAGFCIAIPLHHHPHMTFAGMIVIGIVSAVILGAVLALPTLRVGGFYLGLATIFVAQLIPTVAQYWSLTGGQIGINLFVDPGFEPNLSGWHLYAVLLTLALLSTGFLWLLLSSPLGRKFAALRSSEELTQSLGVVPYLTKLVSVLLGAAFCGIGAAMYVYSQEFFSSGSASVTTVILVLAALVIGGAGTTWGPVVGTGIVFGLNTFISFSDYGGVIFGGLLLLFVMFAPGGAKDILKIKGLVGFWTNRSRPATAGGPVVPDQVGLVSGGVRPVSVATLLSPPRVSTAARPQSSSGAAAAQPAAEPSAPSTGSGEEKGRGEPLTVSRARKSFGGVLAVADVDLELRPGEIHGLIGSNGSGKTTLLNLITGYYKLDGGEVRLGEQVISGLSSAVIARHGIGRTFQTPKIIPGATALDNVLLAVERRHRASDVTSLLRVGAARRVSRANADRARVALESVGLDDQASTKAGNLSHGNQRLVEIARGLAFEPAYILMDEPAAGLSAGELETLKYAIRRYTDAGIGVLIVEHNVPMVLDIATTITALHEGTILFSGTPDELRDNPRVADAFLGETLQAEVTVEAGEPS